MSANRYSVAGWLAVTIVPLYILAAVIIIVQESLRVHEGGEFALAMGPGDVIASVVGLMEAYLLYNFRRLLNERYRFEGVNKPMTGVIVLAIFGSLVVLPMFAVVPSGSTLTYVAVFTLIPVIIAVGILDIVIARRLLAAEDRLNNLIASYAKVLFVAGICNISILFSLLSAFIIEPIALIMLGMVFLREKEQVEFV